MSDDATTRQEMLRVSVFVLSVGAVYLVAFVVLVGRYFAKPARPIGRFGRVVLAVAAAGVVCFLYGRFVEPRWIEVTQTRVETPRLPPGHRGVRIVHLSDVHCDPEPLLEERLPALVASLAPDLVVFTGDAANSPEGVPVFRRCLAEIAKAAPTFGVKGNWDAWFFPEVGRFEGTGATELDGTSATIDVAGAPVRVVGAGWSAGLQGTLGPALKTLPPEGPAVVLYHYPYPDLVPRSVAPRVDLMCAGHVHGGQVALPFYGALITFSKHGKRFERGLYATDEGFPLYVSRGVGMEGGNAPRVRFCARPEVALIELVPAGEPDETK
jgi:predicted MPP superfamily phosphohydrolase